jgi:hypothetical protein
MLQMRPSKKQYYATMARLLIRVSVLTYATVFAIKMLFVHWAEPGLAGFIGFVFLCAYGLWTQLRHLGRAIQKSRIEPVDFVEIVWRWDVEALKRKTWSKVQRIRAWSYVVLAGLGFFAAQLDFHWEWDEPYFLPFLLVSIGFAEILKEVSYDERKAQELD